jgi:hypothetical protein
MMFVQDAPFGMALLGLVLGMRHATDPDHVIAVTTILSREHRISRATRIGLAWGLGHTATVVIAGGAIILFRIAIPVRFGLALDLVVALVLMLLGIPGISSVVRHILGSGATRRTLPGFKDWTAGGGHDLLVHSHLHTHSGRVHRHSHAHVHSHARVVDAVEQGEPSSHRHLLPPDNVSPATPERPLIKCFGIGLIHGLAGSSAIALLVLSAIPQPFWAMLYLAVFCIGTMLGMGLITTAIAAPLALAGGRMARVHRGMVVGSCLLSFGFGFFMMWQTGFGAHLFAR